MTVTRRKTVKALAELVAVLVCGFAATHGFVQLGVAGAVFVVGGLEALEVLVARQEPALVTEEELDRRLADRRQSVDRPPDPPTEKKSGRKSEQRGGQ